jgi:hypothetical protein
MDPTTTGAILDLAPIRADATALAETARTIALVDEATFTAASAILVRIKALRSTVEALFGPHIKRAFDAHRALLDDRRRLDAPLADAEAILKRRLAAFTLEEEQRRAIEARRRALEAHAHQTARVWAEVEDLEAAGYTAEAAELVRDFVQTPTTPLVIVPAPVKAPGIQCREVWRYEVMDPAEVPREYLMIDHAKLGAVVRALKGAAPIPGVRMWPERTIAAKGRGA